jgi:hypothetical protein
MPVAARRGKISAPPPTRTGRTPRVVRVRITGRAHRFLQMMQDLGHLEEEDVTDVLLSLHAANGSRGPAIADLDTVRAAVAYLLFQDDEGSGPGGILAEDWPHLFS